MKKDFNEKIDIVVTWVDGSDPKWQAEKAKYMPKSNSDSSIHRYRDFGFMKYWFRGIEQFAPWVNKIYFVTWGHIPEWLNTKNEKLVVVKHEDFIPKKYLPTFSSRTISLNLYRIKNLSDNFIYIDDDFYIIDKVKPTDFFIDGKPIDTVALNVSCPKKNAAGHYATINNVAVINSHFDFKKTIKSNYRKWFNIKNGKALLRTLALYSCPRFPGFYEHHLSTSLCKKTFEKVWKAEPEILDATCMNKFRTTNDVNIWIMKNWQIAEGNFEIRRYSFGKAFYIDRDGATNVKKELINYIKKQKGKMVAINDGEMTEKEYDQLKTELTEAFDRILPNKSKFEK